MIKHYIALLAMIPMLVMADTPPPGTVKAKVLDGSGNPISSLSGSLNVNVTNPGGGTSSVNQGSQGLISSPWFTQVTNFPSIQPVSQSGSWTLGVSSLPALPAGSNAIGSVTVSNFPSAFNVGNFAAAFGRGWNLTSGADSVAAAQSGAWSTGRTWALNSGTDSVTISGSVTASNPSVSATGSAVPAQATMVGGSDGTNLRALKTSSSGVLSVDGSSVTQPVSGSVSVGNFPGVQAVSQSGTWTVTQGSPPWSTNLTQLAGASPSATNFLPSRLTNGTIYVDPTQIRALSSGTDSVAITAASLPLPAGAATSVNQTNGSQQTQIVQGGNTMAVSSSGSILVSGLSAVGVAPSLNPVSVSGVDGGGLKRHLLTDTSGRIEIDTAQSLPLPAGASTSVLQTTGNSSLASINTKIPALGQTTKSGSLPVTMASDQATVSDGTNTAIIFPSGRLKVEQEATQLFDDTFITGLDTTNIWNTPTTTGTASVVTNTPGEVDLLTGTTANGYATTSSKTTFAQEAPGWVQIYHAVNMSAATPLNAYLFWGAGTIPGTPTATAPLTDAIGFEVDTAGKMYAVTYSAGTRHIIQDLSASTGSAKQPTDTAVHKYFAFYRGDLSYWYIDGLGATNLVATMPTGATGPINNTLPLRLLAIAGSTPPGSAVTMADNAAFVGDTARNNQQLSDGLFPWRKATIKPASTAALSTDTSLVVAVNPNTTVSSKLVDPVLGTGANVNTTGQLQVSIDSEQIFSDVFIGGSIDSNRWNSAVVAGSGAVSQASSALNFTVSTTANNAAAISSQPTFETSDGTVKTFATGMQLEATTIATGNYRFWGLGTPGTAYSTSNPIANGIGFEVTTAGVLRAVMYSADALISSTPLTIPTDGLNHIYYFVCRGNFVVFYMDASPIPVASIGFLNPAASLLPIRLASLNGGSTTVGTPTMAASGTAVLDSSRPSSQIADGTYAFRKATVDAFGNLAASHPDVYVTGASAQTAVVNNILTVASGATATDVSGYRSATVQMVSTGTAGTFIFEGSNDNSNFQAIPVFSQLILTGTPITAAITATATQLVYTFPVTVRYIRVRIVTTITGGSIQAFTRLSQATWTPAVFQVAQATAANMNVTATGSGTYTVSNAAAALATDIASAAHTVSANSATITPPVGSDSNSFQLNETITSGTNQTLDVVIQESWDSGTTWFDIYHFERITANGQYVTPRMRLTGNRIRYVYTVAGTTPSFTFSIARIAFSSLGTVFHRFFDRTISLTTLNSTTAAFRVEDCGQLFAGVNTSGGTIAPTLDIQLSEDGTTYNSMGMTFTPAGTGGQATSTSTAVIGKFARVIVTSAGTGTTDNYVWLKCRGD